MAKCVLRVLTLPYVGVPNELYSTTPPTSGPHLAWTLAPGVYSKEIAEELQVHALEHGHVLIQYAPSASNEQVQILEAIGRQFPREVIVAPYSKLKSQVALTAWGRIQLLKKADRANII